MAKKRRAGGKSLGNSSVKEVGTEDTKLKINSYEDVADSEDEFHINRDKILLNEEPARKRQRKFQEANAFLEPSDEEVLADSEESSVYGGEEEDDVDDDGEAAGGLSGDSHFEGRADLVDDEDTVGWGSSRKDYYNADVIETEADALEEEEEAIRLQKKQLQGMTEADYGFDETDWLDTGKVNGQREDSDQEGIVQEILPQVEITDSMGLEERSKLFSMRYPEFEPLAKEFLALQSTHEELQSAILAAQAVQDHHARAGSKVSDTNTITNTILNSTVKHSTLTTYLAALSMYFAIVTSGAENEEGKLAALAPAKLRDHPIMDSLMKCRALWEKVKDLQIPNPDHTFHDNHIKASDPLPDFSDDRQDMISKQRDVQNVEFTKSKKKRRRKSKAERAAEAAIVEADARRAERAKKMEEELAKLTASTTTTRTLSNPAPTTEDKQPAENDSDSDFGEETVLTAYEAAEKAKRKKSLRFYTSQIAQKANKRDTAGRDAGGDADIPYRERLRDKQARLNTEAEARGKKKNGANTVSLGGDSDEDDRRVAEEIRDGDGGEEDYYDLVTAHSQKKKAEKAALAAAQKEAELQGGVVRVVEEVGADGKRAISYAIEKNKGLAPKRKKDVRNPRVKKRKKYEDKKKKLGSIRQVYKGGEGRGGYGGELTGIKKGLVRSVKL